jgi:hypothetical protein
MVHPYSILSLQNEQPNVSNNQNKLAFIICLCNVPGYSTRCPDNLKAKSAQVIE